MLWRAVQWHLWRSASRVGRSIIYHRHSCALHATVIFGVKRWAPWPCDGANDAVGPTASWPASGIAAPIALRQRGVMAHRQQQPQRHGDNLSNGSAYI